MQFTVKEQAFVLTPNLKHKNFNETPENYQPGVTLEGKKIAIIGKRRGKDFTYNLVEIAPKKYLKIKNLEPMTEVNIGADASKEATVVKVPNNAKPMKWHIILALAGAVSGYAYAKKKNKSMNQCLLMAAAGGTVGFVVGNVIYRKKMVTISNK
jgi:NADPH-dependent curcumin reductase CurA